MHAWFRWTLALVGWGLFSLSAGSTAKGGETLTASRGQPHAAGGTMPHVLTAEYFGWNGGYAGPPIVMARYTSWAIGGDPAQIHAAGMKIYAYTDPNRSYFSDDDYRIHDLLRQHTGAIARNCRGLTITTSHGKGILTDVRTSDAIAHTSSLIKHVFKPGVDAIFMDDSSDVLYTDNGLPCGYSEAAWLADTRAMYAAQSVPLIFNGLSMAEYRVDLLPLADLGNVIGAMWEGCYGFNREWGARSNGTNGLREHWTDIENAELAMAAKRKLFWCFNTARDDGADNSALRTYAYASFLLTYDAKSSLYETQMTTPSKLRVFPETGLVPTSPVIVSPDTVAALQTPGGAYGREYDRCLYRGSPIGACAVVVNPDNAAHATPYAGKYGDTVVLRGGGVLDGGTMSTKGGPVPSTLGAHSAAILTR
jgi:hypothetical protein